MLKSYALSPLVAVDRAADIFHLASGASVPMHGHRGQLVWATTCGTRAVWHPFFAKLANFALAARTERGIVHIGFGVETASQAETEAGVHDAKRVGPILQEAYSPVASLAGLFLQLKQRLRWRAFLLLLRQI